MVGKNTLNNSNNKADRHKRNCILHGCNEMNERSDSVHQSNLLTFIFTRWTCGSMEEKPFNQKAQSSTEHLENNFSLGRIHFDSPEVVLQGRLKNSEPLQNLGCKIWGPRNRMSWLPSLKVILPCVQRRLLRRTLLSTKGM